MTYGPVLGAELFQFPNRVFVLAISAQICLNYFLLIFQTDKLSTKKEGGCYSFHDFRVENFFCLGFENGCPAEGHTEAAMCVRWWLQKVNIKILKTVTWLGFFNIEETYRTCNSGCFWWIKKRLSLYVEHPKIFVRSSRIFLVFS